MFPPFPDYQNPVVGLAHSLTSFQVILTDGTRSSFDVSNPMFKTDLKDKLIPTNATIQKVEVLIFRDTSCVYGIKFMDADHNTLLATGYINTPSYRANEDYLVIKIDLDKGERLVGIKSNSRAEQRGRHYDL